MELLLLLLDFHSISHLLNELLVVSLEALTTVQPDIVLKVVLIFIGKGATEGILIPV